MGNLLELQLAQAAARCRQPRVGCPFLYRKGREGMNDFQAEIVAGLRQELKEKENTINSLNKTIVVLFSILFIAGIFFANSH